MGRWGRPIDQYPFKNQYPFKKGESHENQSASTSLRRHCGLQHWFNNASHNVWRARLEWKISQCRVPQGYPRKYTTDTTVSEVQLQRQSVTHRCRQNRVLDRCPLHRYLEGRNRRRTVRYCWRLL